MAPDTESTTESALVFPCEFPIKAMGLATNDFDSLVVELVRRHVSDLNEDAVRTRNSKKGKYVSVTVNVTAGSQGQLDSIYQELTACEKILMVL